MDVNDNAGCLDERVAWTFFASRLAPTGPERASIEPSLEKVIAR
jgi:hypothetical protein